MGTRAVGQAPVAEAPSTVVLYDGGCALCQRSVRFLNALDRHGVLRYAELTDEWRQAYPGGVVVWTPTAVYSGADAVVQVLQGLGPRGRVVAAWVRFTPGYKKMYRWVAAHRYQIFGRAKASLTSCPAPSSWRGRPLRFSQTPPIPQH
jgi:predicted DCC family thiol-disulfide oxidoreductase YuxK